MWHVFTEYSRLEHSHSHCWVLGILFTTFVDFFQAEVDQYLVVQVGWDVES